MSPELKAFTELVKIVETLRGPNGCPWDKEQTAQTLVPYLIEEAHELAEAIDQGKTPEIIEELGDYLYQVLIQAQVAKDDKQFSIVDVVTTLNQKLIRRHPHVFGDEKAADSAEVLKRWEEIKRQEGKKPKTVAQKVFNYPKSLPALQVAQKIGDKTRRIDFDWPDLKSVVGKMHEEWQELHEELKPEIINKEKAEHELGDLLFTVVQVARHLDIDAESALRKTNQRFQKRFEKMHEISHLDLDEFLALPQSNKEALYQAAKKNLKDN